ncbi:MAG: ABC transporter permease, partial [Acidimicrobiales bacterium]
MRWVLKLIALAAVVVIVSMLTYLMTDLLPGDPATTIAGANASDKEFVDQIRRDLNLDKSLPVRYVDWATAAATGDFGRSLEENPEPVVDKLNRTIPNTLQLMILAEIVAVVVAVPIGVYSGYRANGRFDKFATGLAFFLLATPVFVMGVVLITLLSVKLGWLKTTFVPRDEGGLYESLKSSIMPVICMSVGIIAVYVRLLHADMIATLQEDFILNARAKG